VAPLTDAIEHSAPNTKGRPLREWTPLFVERSGRVEQAFASEGPKIIQRRPAFPGTTCDHAREALDGTELALKPCQNVGGIDPPPPQSRRSVHLGAKTVMGVDRLLSGCARHGRDGVIFAAAGQGWTAPKVRSRTAMQFLKVHCDRGEGSLSIDFAPLPIPDGKGDDRLQFAGSAGDPRVRLRPTRLFALQC
jgi:hypothetical protein